MTEIRLHQACVRLPSGEHTGKLPPLEVASSQWSIATSLLPAERDLSTLPSVPPPALDNVELTVHDGETVVVVGPSGCGKTTLLRAVAGLQSLDNGHVYFDDRDVTDLPARDRGIGMVFQNYALYPHMEGRDNLGFFFKVRHREHEIDERVREVATLLGVGFDELLDRRPRQLSGGQQQRVAIGRCIIRNPTVFLFDEPLSNLDARLRQTTRVEIKRLLRHFRISSLYVTHDQTEAMALADRVAVMRHGVVVQCGSFRHVHDDPDNLFVATFLGLPPCNILPGTVTHGQVHIADATLDNVPAARVHEGIALIAIRPQHLTVTTIPTGSAYSTASIELIERVPSERTTWVTTTLAGRKVRASAPVDLELHPGEVVTLQWAPEHVLLFHPADGLRLRS